MGVPSRVLDDEKRGMPYYAVDTTAVAGLAGTKKSLAAVAAALDMKKAEAVSLAGMAAFGAHKNKKERYERERGRERKERRSARTRSRVRGSTRVWPRGGVG